MIKGSLTLNGYVSLKAKNYSLRCNSKTSLRKPERSQRRLWEDVFNQSSGRCLRDLQIGPFWDVSEMLYETSQRRIWDASLPAEKDFYQTIWGTTKKCEKEFNLIFISIQLSEMHGKGRVNSNIIRSYPRLYFCCECHGCPARFFK